MQMMVRVLILQKVRGHDKALADKEGSSSYPFLLLMLLLPASWYTITIALPSPHPHLPHPSPQQTLISISPSARDHLGVEALVDNCVAFLDDEVRAPFGAGRSRHAMTRPHHLHLRHAHVQRERARTGEGAEVEEKKGGRETERKR